MQFWLAALHEHKPRLVLCAHAPLNKQRTSAAAKSIGTKGDHSYHHQHQVYLCVLDNPPSGQRLFCQKIDNMSLLIESVIDI